MVTANPLTGDPIIQNLEIAFRDAYDDSTCDVQMLQTVDTSFLSTTVRKILDRFQKESNTNHHHAVDSLDFDVKIKTDYNISTLTGLANTVVSEKKIIIGKQERVDTIIIRKK